MCLVWLLNVSLNLNENLDDQIIQITGLTNVLFEFLNINIIEN